MPIALITFCVVLVLFAGYVFRRQGWWKAWFGDSETILLGYLTVLLGLADTAMALVMGTPGLIPPDWMPYWILGSGVLTLIARRLRAGDE